jgi:sugar lactone lactonase YvrE
MLGTKGSEACCRDNIQGDVRAAAQQQLGNLMQISPAGALTTVADVDHFEFSENPVNDPHSNPYALAIDRDGTFLVADAAGNTIVRVDRSGNVRLVVAFDNLRSSPVAGTPGQVNTEAVPTGIAVGADGNYYVSMLGGLMHPTFGRIVQVTPQGVVRTIADGLTSVSSVTVAPDGTVYGTELAKGDIVRVRPDPARPGRFLAPELMYAGELVTPTGIVAGPDGWVYVSDAGVISGQLGGRIVRVRP